MKQIPPLFTLRVTRADTLFTPVDLIRLTQVGLAGVVRHISGAYTAEEGGLR